MVKILLLTILSGSLVAHAELGGSPRTLGSRFTLLQNTVKYTALGLPYQVRQESDSTTKVKWTEYIANNTVFAIEWSGAKLPDLAEGLGQACYQDFILDMTTQQTGDHRHSLSQNVTCTVTSHGRPGQFYGRAFIPDLLPLGFDLQTFQ